ncbi:hypothetical protein [Metamycoplasma neophronis]|uniref:Uncharacterized protein n=1 Tax=Metamycoplasma neophronis TaxID=872983 RepID=A0ABY2Z4R2_9BACT|nr:hypothetical protein [Metamycoplasma neophronis]TPR54107.1 hypothetical protein FJR74_01555 [Metamycoplasma neophronis]
MSLTKKELKKLSEEEKKSFKNYKKYSAIFAKIYHYFNIQQNNETNFFINDFSKNIESFEIKLSNNNLQVSEVYYGLQIAKINKVKSEIENLEQNQVKKNQFKIKNENLYWKKVIEELSK